MISKAEMKVSIAGEFEQGFDEMKQAAHDDSIKWDGAKTALNGAASSIDALLAHIARDVKEDKLTQEEAKACQLYVRRASEIARNLKLKAEVHQQRARGRAEAMKMASDMATRMGQQSQRKVEQESSAEAPGGSVAGLNGRHPGNRAADLRERSKSLPETPPAPNLAVPQNGNGKKPAVKKTKKKVSKKKVSKKTTKKAPRKKG